ncbi:Permease of the drug/metabolite transporter (DMT) superfamily [Candidatus Burkholderia verschuerenii]|uniref:Permease of the drug/metabolite transporter (DMT) superfamily n=1 Tax=Candidatus Burkholderia verschuerenii TaxID=242163 RepID=A0A0L0MC50_9BURK|nr:DMT family transporter [Candidatus Burkholderia verschuerenii]KND59923.1 Permease of the drug/metabolite transporter (DMT) superfamily [Candidatus Burkholderia verschuerenii]
MLSSFAAPVFVFLWSTGFIVARAITLYVDPNLYLLARFTGTTLLLGAIALIARAPWPKPSQAARHLFAGALLQGVYLGAGYWAVAQGMAAGIMALLGALQPLLTAAIAARLFGERLSARAWSGLVLGLAGVALVLAPKIAASGTLHGSAPPWLVVSVALLAVVAITAGTLYQKSSLAGADIRSAATLQNAGAALVAMMLAFSLGEHRFVSSPTTWLALAWGIVMLSGVAATLLVWMVRRGDASRATALMFLAPPLAALEGYLAFGERLGPIQLAGFALALAGVLLARSR